MTLIDLPDERATAALAARLAPLAAAGDVIALAGDLGTGKTSFARAFIRARLGDPKEEVPSPTFTLVQIYEPKAGNGAPRQGAGEAIWHFDLYRLESPEDAWELAIEDAFRDGISLIEWPDRLGPLLPSRRLEIALTAGDRVEARRAVLSASETWQHRLHVFGTNG